MTIQVLALAYPSLALAIVPGLRCTFLWLFPFNPLWWLVCTLAHHVRWQLGVPAFSLELCTRSERLQWSQPLAPRGPGPFYPLHMLTGCDLPGTKAPDCRMANTGRVCTCLIPVGSDLLSSSSQQGSVCCLCSMLSSTRVSTASRSFLQTSTQGTMPHLWSPRGTWTLGAFSGPWLYFLRTSWSVL